MYVTRCLELHKTRTDKGKNMDKSKKESAFIVSIVTASTETSDPPFPDAWNKSASD